VPACMVPACTECGACLYSGACLVRVCQVDVSASVAVVWAASRMVPSACGWPLADWLTGVQPATRTLPTAGAGGEPAPGPHGRRMPPYIHMYVGATMPGPYCTYSREASRPNPPRTCTCTSHIGRRSGPVVYGVVLVQTPYILVRIRRGPTVVQNDVAPPDRYCTVLYESTVRSTVREYILYVRSTSCHCHWHAASGLQPLQPLRASTLGQRTR
jgi:hypothetical protein